MSIQAPAGTYTVGLAGQIIGSVFVWSISGNSSSTLTANPDGKSAKLVLVGTESVTISVSNYEGSPWKPRQRYRLNAQILDGNRHTQQVTAVSGPGATAIPVAASTISCTAPAEPTEPKTAAGVQNHVNVYQDYKGSDNGLPSNTIVYTTAGFSGPGISDGLASDGSSFGGTPAFSTIGGTTVDGQLTWTDEGAASNNSTWTSLVVVGTVGATAPANSSLLLPHS